MNIPDTSNWSFEQKLIWLKNCTPKQWESLCKGCGVCCLVKFGCIFGAGVIYSRCACTNLDLTNRKCRIYNKRISKMKGDCRKVSVEMVVNENLLPDSCGYKEFLYGPARFPANVYWPNVENVSNDDAGLNYANEHTITQSIMWTSPKSR